MGKLRDLLKTEAERIRNEREKQRAALAEWLGILDELFRRVDAWLDASDPDGLLERTSEQVELWDPALGQYKAPTRRITAGKRSAQIIPSARYIAWPIRPSGAEHASRAHGLVELRDPLPSIGRTYYLFQLPGNQWYIKTNTENISTSENAVEPLDAERFEAVLASLLG